MYRLNRTDEALDVLRSVTTLDEREKELLAQVVSYFINFLHLLYSLSAGSINIKIVNILHVSMVCLRLDISY